MFSALAEVTLFEDCATPGAVRVRQPAVSSAGHLDVDTDDDEILGDGVEG
jgi:hypothetical protein